MLHATFDEMNASAAVSGAYQYDTGQRLYMYGLPTPQELDEADELLSGEMATVQVHFGLRGDSQTQARLALWDDDRGCWTAAVPDEYLQLAENVYAYVYISYGQDEAGNGRTKTAYELTFRPISRPAPNSVATSVQWEVWATKKDELDLELDALQSAADGLDESAADAQEAAQVAADAAQAATDAAQAANAQTARLAATERLWDGMAVQTVGLAAGSSATANIDGGVLTLGLPRGAQGAKGETGDTGPADITLAFADGVLTITPV